MFTFEVRFIWAARWNLTKCLYLLTRYLQFVLVRALIYQSRVVVLLSTKALKNFRDSHRKSPALSNLHQVLHTQLQTSVIGAYLSA